VCVGDKSAQKQQIISKIVMLSILYLAFTLSDPGIPPGFADQRILAHMCLDLKSGNKTVSKLLHVRDCLLAEIHLLCCCVIVVIIYQYDYDCYHYHFVAVQARSLLTAHEDFTTLMFTSPTEIQRPGLVFSFLKKHMPSEDTVEEVKRMSLTADGKSAVFDVPSKLAQVACSSCIHIHLAIPLFVRSTCIFPSG